MARNTRSESAEQERQAACLVLLRDFICGRALASARSPNPTLRFCANMLALENLLLPRFADDELGQLVITPAWPLVRNWIQANSTDSAK
jgi:hypothetical protein